MSKQKLTEKQKKFCNEYLKGKAATQAAISAGYSKKTAAVIAAENLTKPNIRAYISERQEKLQEKVTVSQERVVEELALLGFSNVQDFLTGANGVSDLTNLTRQKTAAIKGIKTIVREVTVDKVTTVTTTTDIDFHNKIEALEKLSRIMGYFKKDNEQTPPPPPPAEVQVNLSHLSFEQLKELKYGKK